MESITKRNEHIFSRSYKALLKGIRDVYYREDESRDRIIEVYRDNYYRHINLIHDMIINYITINIGEEFSKKTIYNNYIVLFILFFIVDVENNGLDKKKIEDFAFILISEGFKHNRGEGNIQINFSVLFRMIELNYDSFTNFKLLGFPRFSVLFSKNKVDEPINKQLTIEVPKTPQYNDINQSNTSFLESRSTTPTSQYQNCQVNQVNQVNQINQINQVNQELLMINQQKSLIESLVQRLILIEEENKKLNNMLMVSMQENKILNDMNAVLLNSQSLLTVQNEELKEKNKLLYRSERPHNDFEQSIINLIDNDKLFY